MKKVGKKKDIIDANFNNTIKNENEIKEKRSLFFEDNDNQKLNNNYKIIFVYISHLKLNKIKHQIIKEFFY